MSDEGPVWGNEAVHERGIRLGDPKRRRRCGCGCGKRANHVGTANGIGLRSGCEWRIRLWVRDPDAQTPYEQERTRKFMEDPRTIRALEQERKRRAKYRDEYRQRELRPAAGSLSDNPNPKGD